MRFVSYMLKRALASAITLLLLSVLIFYTTTFFSPAARASLFIPESSMSGGSSPDPLPVLIEKFGLNDPFFIQYGRWLREVLLNRNFGWSYSFGEPVTYTLRRSFAATLELVMYSAPIGIIGGYKIGSLLAKRASSKAPKEDPIDFAARSATVVVYSIPPFVLGFLLLLLFFHLGRFEYGRLGINASTYVYGSKDWIGYTGLFTIDSLLNGNFWMFLDALEHLALPVMTLAAAKMAIVVRITRSSVLRETFKNYVVAAKAKGLSRNEVLGHARRNSLISVFTITGTLLGGMLTGVIVTDIIFGIGGIGMVVFAAARRLDIALIVALALLFCVIFMLVNLIVDLAYGYIDARAKQ